MHVLLTVPYSPDTVVVDEPSHIVPVQPQPAERGPRPEEPRDPIDEASTVQVMIDDSGWHRELDSTSTACGLTFVWPLDRRNKKYEGQLAPTCECWSRRERLLTWATNEINSQEFTRLDWRAPTEPVGLSAKIDEQRQRKERIAQRLAELLKEQP
jgi:hypothetical protein